MCGVERGRQLFNLFVRSIHLIVKQFVTKQTLPQEQLEQAGSINNWQMMHLVAICRLLAVVSLLWLVRREIFGGNQAFQGEAELSILPHIGVIVIYLLNGLIPLGAVYNRPLRILNEKWFIAPALIEVGLIVVASWMYPKHEQVLVLMLVLSIGVLSRFPSRYIERIEYAVGISWGIIFLQSLAVWILGESSQHNQLIADLPMQGLIMTFVVAALWRHNQQNRPRLIRSNLEFSIAHMQEQADAAICFLRVPTVYNDRHTLFLITTAPTQAYRNLFYPDVVALDMEANSIATLAYRSQTVQSANAEAELRKNLTQINPIREYNLKKGMALPLPSKQGVVSIYWDNEDVSLADTEKVFSSQLKHLSSYLESYKEYIQPRVQNTLERRLIPTRDWAETNKLTQELFRNTDIWESAQLLVDGITKIANARGACILFYDEETRTFAADARGKGISQDCSYTLANSVYHKETLNSWLKEQEPDCLSLHIPVHGNESQQPDCLAFPLRTKEYPSDSNAGHEWEWIGLLLLDLPKGDYIKVLKYRQLEMIALNGATDLRNCQLHLKSEIDRHAQDTLTQIIQSLFDEQTIPKDEMDFLQIVRDVVHDGLETPHTAALGIMRAPYEGYDQSRWISNSGIKWSYMGGQSEQRAEIEELLAHHDSERNVRLFNYESGETDNQRFHLRKKIKQSYAIAIPLDKSPNNLAEVEKEMLIIYVNYAQFNPEHSYTTRHIFSIISEPIQQSWRMWHRWRELVDQERAYQRQFWHNEIHDQLNELQSNVMRPLELLVLHLQREGLDNAMMKAKRIYRGSRGINATLKQVNQDIRDKVYHQQGLFAALENLRSRTRDRERLEVFFQGVEPPPRVSGPIYLIAREAVVNAFKHGAKSCEISVSSSRTNAIQLSICDDGPGYLGEPRDGSGISIMRYQAQLIGAKIDWTICSRSGGTQVTVVRNLAI